MLRLGIIGTSWITKQFIEAVNKTGKIKLNSVYSRTIEKAKIFGDEYNVENYFDDLEKMAKSNTIDICYIASPNSLHIEQAKIFVNNGIAVFVEKPVAINKKDLEDLIKLGKEKNVLIMEGLMTTHRPNLKQIKENLHKIGPIRKLNFFFCQYSSKYNKFKNGEYVNAFDPKWGNGGLMDLAVYPLSVMVNLFGTPNNINANATILKNSIDAEGNILASYDSFSANIIYSKISNGFLKSEIQGEKGSILIGQLSTMNDVTIHYNDGNKENISTNQDENPMFEEIQSFIETYENKEIENKINSFNNSLIVQDILDKVRDIIGIKF